MGHRANLLVVREGESELYYSHWAAITLPHDLFWGPRHALAFTEAQRPVDGWLDEVWAEGGSVIDTDRRILRLFGGEDLRYDAPLRRLYLALLAIVWQGWDVGWADEGIAELADCVGYPRDHVLTDDCDEPSVRDLRPPEEPDWVDFVGSVRLSDGSLRLYPLVGAVASPLVNGPSLAEAAGSQQGLERLAFTGQMAPFPSGGFHLDLRSNDLRYWTGCDQPGIRARVAARWPGWTTTWLHDRYEDQLAACAGRLSFPVRTPEALFAELRQILLQESPTSMTETILELAERQRAAGIPVEINPNALRDDRLDLPIAARAEILRRAAAELGLVESGI